MDHHILVIDIESRIVRAVLVTPQRLQQIDDTEDFIVIDPLTNQFFHEGEWQAIPTAVVKEFNGIMTLE